MFLFLFQAEDGIRDLVRSRGLGDVYKRQLQDSVAARSHAEAEAAAQRLRAQQEHEARERDKLCLLYTSDAADERSSVDLGGRRIIKKKITSTSRILDVAHRRAQTGSAAEKPEQKKQQ